MSQSATKTSSIMSPIPIDRKRRPFDPAWARIHAKTPFSPLAWAVGLAAGAKVGFLVMHRALRRFFIHDNLEKYKVSVRQQMSLIPNIKLPKNRTLYDRLLFLGIEQRKTSGVPIEKGSYEEAVLDALLTVMPKSKISSFSTRGLNVDLEKYQRQARYMGYLHHKTREAFEEIGAWRVWKYMSQGHAYISERRMSLAVATATGLGVAYLAKDMVYYLLRSTRRSVQSPNMSHLANQALVAATRQEVEHHPKYPPKIDRPQSDPTVRTVSSAVSEPAQVPSASV